MATAALSGFVVDTFTDTAGDSLASHTGETGAAWTKHTSYGTGSAAISDEGVTVPHRRITPRITRPGTPRLPITRLRPILLSALGSVRSHVNGCEHDVLLSLPGGR